MQVYLCCSLQGACRAWRPLPRCVRSGKKPTGWKMKCTYDAMLTKNKHHDSNSYTFTSSLCKVLSIGVNNVAQTWYGHHGRPRPPVAAWDNTQTNCESQTKSQGLCHTKIFDPSGLQDHCSASVWLCMRLNGFSFSSHSTRASVHGFRCVRTSEAAAFLDVFVTLKTCLF
jgi:hypothetical protein